MSNFNNVNVNCAQYQLYKVPQLTSFSFNLINRVKNQLCQSQKWQYQLCWDELCACRLDGGLTMTLRNNKHPNSSTLPLELHNTNAMLRLLKFTFIEFFIFVWVQNSFKKLQSFRPHYIFHMYALLGSVPRSYSKMKFDHFFEQMDNFFLTSFSLGKIEIVGQKSEYLIKLLFTY